MSWDVFLMNVPSEIGSIADLPKDFSSELGPRSKVLSRIGAILPDLDLTDPTYGYFEGGDFSIEFYIGEDDPISQIMLAVRGSNSAVNTIQNVCENTGWRAFDTTAGDFINFAGDPAEGLRQWRGFKNQVFASLEAEGKEVHTDEKGIRVGASRVPRPRKERWWQFQARARHREDAS